MAPLSHTGPERGALWDAARQITLLTLLPLAGAVLAGGLLLLLLGVDPGAYYRLVLARGLLSDYGRAAALTRSGPLLLLAASLIVAFRAGVWNLGGDGQYLLAAVAAAAAAPVLATRLPVWLMLPSAMLLGAAVGAAWSVLPAVLRARQGVNEIISTLMTTFLGVSLANVLVKLVLRDPATTVPQTRTLPFADRLPRLFGTAVSSGLLIGLLAILLVHLLMTRTAFGLRLRVLGANPRAAIHAGLAVPRLILAAFGISAGLAGLAGAVDILGEQGNVQADWNPAYTLAVVPLVFLARLNGIAAIGFVFLFSVLSIGGESAALHLGVPNHFTLVIVALLLIMLALAEYLDRSRRTTRGG